MSTETPTPPRAHSSVARVLIVVLLLFIVGTLALWYAGLLEPKPRLPTTQPAPAATMKAM